MSFQLPGWMEQVPLHRREQARTRFILRLAALYASESGEMKTLSRLCGYHRHTIATTAGSSRVISAEMARTLENILGRELFPREFLNPRVFGDTQEEALERL